MLLTDAEGRDQPLVAVYRTESLRRELALVATEHGGLAHLPLRLLTADLDLRRLPAEDATASFDCDTWEDLAAARARIRDHGRVLDEWITAVKDELGIELDVDTAALLDLARDAAHGVARPAAPLTTFLAGYAAAQAGGGPEAVAEAARKAAALAARWAEESAEDPGKTTE
ncbi:molybdopterin-guanine dinucleotide biosynthesis protein [Streptomyces lycii]|uniref:Molybdopterin-guanine dinucleotide biosynthesis protein n=1 Tax=Streptomyces lycii TaxID=2654337 RepID=A0ABQ7FH95_9ACTN|nr:molybdopterin-guanine dinucleotide biosynthesis protein [Streptomyces lycii]